MLPQIGKARVLVLLLRKRNTRRKISSPAKVLEEGTAQVPSSRRYGDDDSHQFCAHAELTPTPTAPHIGVTFSA